MAAYNLYRFMAFHWIAGLQPKVDIFMSHTVICLFYLLLCSALYTCLAHSLCTTTTAYIYGRAAWPNSKSNRRRIGEILAFKSHNCLKFIDSDGGDKRPSPKPRCTIYLSMEP